MSRSKQYDQNRGIRILLVSAVCILAGLHILSVFLTHNAAGTLLELAPKFDLDNEFNVPTVYSGILWGVAAFLSFLLLTRTKLRIEKFGWAFLSLFFFYISFDEQMVIHERFAEPIRSALSISDNHILYHAWVIPAIALTALILGLYFGLKGVSKTSIAQKQILKYVAILGIGIVALEALGTIFYFSPAVYKLGPVLVEELFEISMASFLVYKLHLMVSRTE